MTGHIFSRTQRLIGQAALTKLQNSHVLLFGVGGVGGALAEALVRSGIGALTLVDADRVDITNLNRQSIATQQTIGQRKADAAKERLLSVNPGCRVRALPHFYLPDDPGGVWDAPYDYIADAIDTVSAKLDIAIRAQQLGTPLISVMGTGNKLDPTQFEVADIYSTSVCPLCRVMRRELKTHGISALKVVYSRETPRKPFDISEKNDTINTGIKRATPASIAFVPPAAGLIAAGEIIKDLIAGY